MQIQSAYLPGYNGAIASSLRDGPLRGLSQAYSALAKHKQDLLLIWVCRLLRSQDYLLIHSISISQGTDDNSVPYRYAARIRELVPNSKLITIEGGHHDLTLSHPDDVCDALLQFFNLSDTR